VKFCFVDRYNIHTNYMTNIRKLPVKNDGKSYLKSTFSLRSVIKQHIEIKILTYLCLITKLQSVNT
jgi:hypothetical protein